MEQISCILCVLIHLIGYSSSYQYEINHLGEGYSWNQAMEECEKIGGSLPEVIVTGDLFELVNQDLQHDASQCLWLRATYERVDKWTDERNRYSCCEAINRVDIGTHITDCIPCKGQNRYVCADDNNTISWKSSNNTLNGSWLTAAQNCSTHAHGLPSDTNAELIKFLPVQQYFWVNVVRSLNLNPKQGDGMFSLCLCGGRIDLKCIRPLRTYCIHESTGRSGISSSLSSSFRTFSSASSNAPTFSAGSLQASRDSDVSTTTRATMNTGGSGTSSSFTNPSLVSSNVPKLSSGNVHVSRDLGITTSTRENRRNTLRDKKDQASVSPFPQTTLQMSEKRESDNGPLIGGVAGACVLLIIIVIIVVTFIFRRSKKTPNKNSNPQSPVNPDNFLKGKIHVNVAYSDVDGEFPDANKQASIQIQNLENESITYATRNKVAGSSEITRNNNIGITANEEQSRTAVYGMVKKVPGTGQKLNNKKQDKAGNEEYDKISFGKSYQVESSGNVYDKTNVHLEPQDEHFENVYNKANFYLEPRNEHFENVYNKANFYREPQDMDAGNVYDQANFHGGPQDERSGNVYAKSNFNRDPQAERTGN